MLVAFVDYIGRTVLTLCERFGKMGVFVGEMVVTFLTTKLRTKKVFYHMSYIGVHSIGVVFLIGATIGAALALQTYIGLERYGATQFIGPIVFISMTREFGPVFTAIMVIGRAGSAITAELGTMRITEQIDALQTLCINPHQYLTVPRLVAGTLIFPFLSIFCSLFGILAGFITSVYVLGANPEEYRRAIVEYVALSDITNGLIKATVFGFLLIAISIYKGYFVRGGAKGVGIAITQSVVYSILTVAVADYILTSFLFTNK